ncbi:hypothetical protein [Sphingomonas psychrotolerans]|uniref:Uncharacterized protein n=1 Tax=Sphingomonas psychrotolerans TaxID=1327635 RepID=A0A2K8MF72_9SPHN|nr:hypothetical protein [Sphingomonas psychrotolerans]ATY32538.1 hypothetical protein CVN68_11595 [Sphingomonas psychrotolerans]
METDSGPQLDARIEIEDGAVLLHSRSGGPPRNSHYEKVLELIIRRLRAHEKILGQQIDDILIDSTLARPRPRHERILVSAGEISGFTDSALITRIRQTARKWGQEPGTVGGNSTKALRIEVRGQSAQSLRAMLKLQRWRISVERLTSELQRQVTPANVARAVERLVAGEDAPNFGESRDYDLVTPDGTLERPHQALRTLLRQDERRREKIATSTYPNWELAPIFDVPDAARKLRVANALMNALAKLGHPCKLGGVDLPSFHATVGDQDVHVKIHHPGAETATYRRHNDALPAPAKTPLTIELFPALPDGFPRLWHDDTEKLESKLSEVAAAVIAAGEARYRLGIVERLEHIARMEAWREEQRQEALVRRNKERLAALHRSAEMLRQANDLRALIAAVGTAMEKGHRSLDANVFVEWKSWAAAEADRLDPVISGQVDEHLLQST